VHNTHTQRIKRLPCIQSIFWQLYYTCANNLLQIDYAVKIQQISNPGQS